MAQSSKKKTEVLKTIPENEDVVSVYLAKPDDQRFWNFNSGQFASLRLKRDHDWSEPHPFTLSCAPDDDFLRMTIKKAGQFTQAVHDMQSGQEVEISGPFGTFCQKIEEQDPIVMIAGGVGITPFLSVLRHLKNSGSNKRLTLFWCNRTRQNIFALSELKELLQSLNLRLVHVLSRDQVEDLQADTHAGMFYEQGHITRDILDRHCRPTESAIYLCGPPGMQDSVIEELRALGVNPDRVDTEAFVYRSQS